jgi:hypothetical protein
MIFTDSETRAQRTDTCNSCENKKGVRCNGCGCFILFLTKVKDAKCPTNKWTDEQLELL